MKPYFSDTAEAVDTVQIVQVVQQEKSIAYSLATCVLATLNTATCEISTYLTSGKATTEGILTVLDDVLADLQTSTAKVQRLTANFDRLCERVREAEHEQENS